MSVPDPARGAGQLNGLIDQLDAALKEASLQRIVSARNIQSIAIAFATFMR